MKAASTAFKSSHKKLCSTLDTNIIPCRSQSTNVFESPVSKEALSKARSFDEVPGPKPIPFIGNIHRYLPAIGEYSTKKWHVSMQDKYDKYGPIVREVMVPGFSMVHLFGKEDIETVSRYEGRFPRREFFTGMKKLRVENPDRYKTAGVAAGNGADWQQLRTKSQKVLMRPQIMRQYLPQMNVIADDFVRRVRLQRTSNMQVPGLMDELFKWALESITYILFNQRFGCLSDDLTEQSKALKYIRAVNKFFQSSAKVELGMLPIWRKFPKLSPSFRELERVHNFFFDGAMEYVNERIAKLNEKENIDENNLSLMEMLLQQCTPEHAAVMAIDAMAAGIDTTSLSTAYVLRHLAANPEKQKKLQEEIDNVLPNKTPLSPEVMERIPYLRACVKESMRITPVVQGTARTLDYDIVLSGFRILANTPISLNYFVSSVQESNYPDPLKYKPERWLKDSVNKAVESFAFQPFGFGPRMCIGRRIAELEMFTLLTKIVQNFWVENKQTDLDINFQLVLMIKNPLEYEFYERK